MDAQQQQYTIFALVAVVVIGVVSFVFLNQKKPKAVKAESKTSKRSSASVPAPAAAAAVAVSSDAEGTASGTEAAKKKRKKRSKAKASSKGQVIAPVGQMDDAPESDDEEDTPTTKPEAPPAPKEAPKPKKTMEEKAFEEILKMDDKKNKDKKKDNKKGNGKKSPVVAKMEDSAEADESDGEDAIFLTGKAAAAADGWAVVEKKGGKQAKKADAAPSVTSSAPASALVVEPVTASTPSASAEETEAAVPDAQEEEDASEEEDKTPTTPPVPVIEKFTQELTVEAKRLGLLIGVKGATRIAIQSATDTNIQMPKTEKDSTGDVTISVTGEEAGVAKAITAMKELLAKGYCLLLSDPDFRESDATVHPRFLPDIIGKNGSVIKALSQHTGVKITVPTASKAPGPDGKVSKVKIGLAGPKDKVALCRNLIKEITRYYHTEVTHPNIVHEEMTIDAKYYNFIIGAKGSEIKHIQNSYKVSVHIPDADSVNPNVLIVGEATGVANALRHIEKLIEKVNERNNPKPKETAEESEDSGESSSEAQTPTAPQDGEESWMKELGPPAGEAFPATIAAPIGLTKPENGKPAWNTLAAGKTW
jgi:rRNA processing protein Krr1/Pno1